MKIKPLIPRQFNLALAGISYEEYLQQKPVNLIVKQIEMNTPQDEISVIFGNKIQYLIDSVKNLETKQLEIKELWELCFQLISEKTEPNISSLQSVYIYPLVSLTGEANFSIAEIKAIDSKLDANIKIYLDTTFNKDYEFSTKIEQLLQWHNYHREYLEYLKIGSSVGEIGYLKEINENYSSELEKLKTSSPQTFLNFIELIKINYKEIELDYKLKFRLFYLEKSLEQIIVARNSGNFYNYDKILEDYYSEKLRNQKYLNWVYKKFAGYGEKPWKMVFLFFSINFLFAVLFTFGEFQFHFAILPSNLLGKFLTFISFNNTTMLTVGYGDIYPEGGGARLMVALLQIFGFIISTSATALFLRKILRF